MCVLNISQFYPYNKHHIFYKIIILIKRFKSISQNIKELKLPKNDLQIVNLIIDINLYFIKSESPCKKIEVIKIRLYDMQIS